MAIQFHLPIYKKMLFSCKTELAFKVTLSTGTTVVLHQPLGLFFCYLIRSGCSLYLISSGGGVVAGLCGSGLCVVLGCVVLGCVVLGCVVLACVVVGCVLNGVGDIFFCSLGSEAGQVSDWTDE